MIQLINRIYATLLRMYPRNFQVEFKAEMQIVFEDAINDAIKHGNISLATVCLREARDWLLTLLREHYFSLRSNQKEAIMRVLKGHLIEHKESESAQQDKSGSWIQALAGMVLFIVSGLDLIINEIPHSWSTQSLIFYIKYPIFLGSIVIPAIGFGIGWVKGFPPWSYPYAGLELLLSLYMTGVSTPGLKIFNYTFGRNDQWCWRAWIPFAVIALIALLFTRSLRSICKLFIKIRHDWTLLTFTMFGSMPLLIAACFDEVDRLYSLPFMVILTCVMACTAMFYLRSRRSWHQVLSLAVGITILLVIVALAPSLYWAQRFQNGWADVMPTFIVMTFVEVVMLSPALVRMLRRPPNSSRLV